MRSIIPLIIALLGVSASAETLKVFAGIEGFPQKPFADWKEGEAEPAGLDSDLLRLIAKEMKVTLEFVNPVLTEDTRFLRRELLESKEVDLVAYAYTVTEERKKHVAFSRPYFKSSLAALVRKDSELKTLEQIRKCRALAFKHTTAWQWARANVVDPGRILTTWPAKFATLESYVISGEVDAFLGDFDQLKLMARGNPALRVVEEKLQEEQLAIAVRKDAKELLERVDAALEKIEKDGSLRELRARYRSSEKKSGESPSGSAEDKS